MNARTARVRRAPIQEAAEQVRVNYPAHPPNGSFFLQVHPGAIDCVHDGTRWRVCYQLRRFVVAKGVNGSVQLDDGTWRVRAALAGRRERGWHIIAQDLASDEQGVGYVAITEVAGGDHHHTIWETLHEGSRRVTVDRVGMLDWHDSLIKDGHLPPIPEWSVQTLRENVERQTDAAVQRAQRDARYGREADQLTQRLAAIDEHLKTYKPKPARRARRVAPKAE